MAGTISTPRSLPGDAIVPIEVVAVADGTAALPRQRRLGRPIVVAHAVTLALAFGVWAYLDRHLWFFGDEWDFLTRRGLHRATFSIWAPHNEHWSVLPILLWRAIFSVAHVSTYWPYLVPLLLVHVAVVYLLWRRCLKEGADPWVVTALTLLLALFGTGAEDLAWAFQIGFVSSLALGLVALEVAEVAPSHRLATVGKATGRDVALWLLLVASLMCSDVGLATSAAVGVVLLARFGWRRLVRVLSVPAVVYVVWFAAAGRTGLSATGDRLTGSTFFRIPTFVATNLEKDLGHASGWADSGWPLAIAIVAWLLWRSRALFREHPAVLGGAVGALGFYALAAVGRDRISATLSPSRYAYIATALLVPAVAVMLSSLLSALRQWRPAPDRRVRSAQDRRWSSALTFTLARTVIVVLVAVAIMANLGAASKFTNSRAQYVRGLKDQIITTAALLQTKEQMARAINVYPVWASGFASGYLTPWELANLYRQGILPRPLPALMTSRQVREDESWLDLSALHRRLFAGGFVLVARWHGSRARTHAGAASSAWPAGPGACTFSSLAGAPAAPARVTLGLERRARTGAVWISLGAAGGRAHFYLARTWGFGGRPGYGFVNGENVQVPAHGDLWVNDSVPGDRLILALSAGQRAELCGLARPAGVS